jgi:hypothetical protein
VASARVDLWVRCGSVRGRLLDGDGAEGGGGGDVRRARRRCGERSTHPRDTMHPFGDLLGPPRENISFPQGQLYFLFAEYMLYLLMFSQDQTTRIHGPIGPSRIWHELARPQVHGYDLTDAAFVGPGALRLVSSADEKIARVFDAPKGFVRTVCALGTVEWEGEQANQVSLWFTSSGIRADIYIL